MKSCKSFIYSIQKQPFCSSFKVRLLRLNTASFKPRKNYKNRCQRDHAQTLLYLINAQEPIHLHRSLMNLFREFYGKAQLLLRLKKSYSGYLIEVVVLYVAKRLISQVCTLRFLIIKQELIEKFCCRIDEVKRKNTVAGKQFSRPKGSIN